MPETLSVKALLGVVLALVFLGACTDATPGSTVTSVVEETEVTSTTTDGFAGPTDTTPPAFDGATMLPLAEGFGVVCSGIVTAGTYATLEGPWVDPGVDFDAIAGFYEEFLNDHGFAVIRALDEPKWVTFDGEGEESVVFMAIRPTMHSTLVITARADERPAFESIAEAMREQAECWGADEVSDAASGVYGAFGGFEPVGDPELSESLLELIATAELPWRYEGWSIGPVLLDATGDPGRFVSVSRGGEEVFLTEISSRCEVDLMSGPAVTEPELDDFFAEVAADRDRLPGEHEYTLAKRSVEILGRPAFVTSWTHARDRRLEEALVQLWVTGGPEPCILFAPGGDSDHGPGFDPEVVIDSAPVLNAFADSLTDLLSGRAAGVVADDPELWLAQIEALRSSAGPGSLAGFVHLTGEDSTGAPASPEQPVCVGSGDFADIAPGATVSVRDDTGSLIAATILRGAGFDGHFGCGMWFGVDVSAAEWYTISIGSHAAEPASVTQLDSSDWIADLWGDPIGLQVNCVELDSEPHTCLMLEP